jgi:hypothetical protein
VNALFRDQHEWNRKIRSSNIIVERANVIIVIVSAMTVVNIRKTLPKWLGRWFVVLMVGLASAVAR